MQNSTWTEDESSSKVTPPELKEFSELIEREAYRKQLTRKKGSLNQLEKVSVSLWEPKFELEDFNVPPKEEQLIRAHSEPLIKERVSMLVEEEERASLVRGTKRVRGAITNTPIVSEERRLESFSGGRIELDLNKVVEDSFSSN